MHTHKRTHVYANGSMAHMNTTSITDKIVRTLRVVRSGAIHFFCSVALIPHSSIYEYSTFISKHQPLSPAPHFFHPCPLLMAPWDNSTNETWAELNTRAILCSLGFASLRCRSAHYFNDPIEIRALYKIFHHYNNRLISRYFVLARIMYLLYGCKWSACSDHIKSQQKRTNPHTHNYQLNFPFLLKWNLHTQRYVV